MTNAGWLDGAAMDGLRNCFEEEFTAIFIFNLRGNARTQGELRRREAGNVFDSGSRAPIAITILVKDPAAAPAPAEIHYVDIGDYLSREDKLARIADFHSVLSDNFRASELIITPNARHDWINQRGDSFDSFIILGDKKDKANIQTVFCDFYSKGIMSARDPWCYNFSCVKMTKNINAMIDFYNSHSPEDIDETKIVWNRSVVQNKNRGIKSEFAAAKIVEAMYRPFCCEHFYYDRNWNEMSYQMPKFFPTGNEANLLICISGIGGTKDLSVLITDKITDVQFQFNGQCFPLYWYEASAQQKFEGFGEKDTNRRDGVTDWILARARAQYGRLVTKEDIFYYVYGFLHLPAYRAEFAAELKKSLPRIILVERAEDFWRLKDAGWELAQIHLNYERQPKTEGVAVEGALEDLSVRKMKLVREGDLVTLVYNSKIKIVGIPARAKEYVVNGRSPLEWLVERYQIKTDKASGITNDPNLWCAEHGGASSHILRFPGG